MIWLALVLLSAAFGAILAVEALTKKIAVEISINQGHRIPSAFYHGALYPRWYSRSKLGFGVAVAIHAAAAYRSASLLGFAVSLGVAALVVGAVRPLVRSRLAPVYPRMVARDLDKQGRHPLAFERIALGWLTAVRPDLRATLREPSAVAAPPPPYVPEPITAA